MQCSNICFVRFGAECWLRATQHCLVQINVQSHGYTLYEAHTISILGSIPIILSSGESLEKSNSDWCCCRESRNTPKSKSCNVSIHQAGLHKKGVSTFFMQMPWIWWSVNHDNPAISEYRKPIVLSRYMAEWKYPWHALATLFRLTLAYEMHCVSAHLQNNRPAAQTAIHYSNTVYSLELVCFCWRGKLYLHWALFGPQHSQCDCDKLEQ